MKADIGRRIEGAIWGLLVGDALGVPYEFQAAEQLPFEDEIDFEPPAYFRRSHAGVPPGTWSDDGAQALCLLASLLYCGELDPEDLMRRLVNWREHGYMAVGGRVFDVGIQTSKSLDAFRFGRPALECGGVDQMSNGNGSLMRVLPLALWHQGSDRELVEDARLQSRITHAHLRSQLCCALYCLWARRILEENHEPWNAAVTALRALIPAGSPEEEELEFQLRPDADKQPGGSGYVVDSLFSAKWAFARGAYPAVVRGAVRLGHDTDTTACIAGGLAGLRDGLNAIPERWRQDLREPQLFKQLLGQLVERVA